MLEPEPEQFVACDQALGLRGILAALDRVAEQ